MAKRLYIGGYSNKIILASLHKSKLELTAAFDCGQANNFLALHPNGRFLYATNCFQYAIDEKREGILQAFSINPNSGDLKLLNQVRSYGSYPVHISVHPSGKWLLFANYVGANFGSTAIFSDGSLSSVPISLISVQGSGPNSDRQKTAHPHQIITDPSGKFAFVSDLGTDRIHQFIVDENGSLSPNPAAQEISVLPAGAGPRHLIFKCPFAYGLNELENSVTLYKFDADLGTLQSLKSWSTLDESMENKSGFIAAELAISEDNQFLYVSNRYGAEGAEGDNSIAVFRIDGSTGDLAKLGLRKFDKRCPRHFLLDEASDSVLVAFQFSDNVSVYGRNSISGELGNRLSSLEGINQPTCIIAV